MEKERVNQRQRGGETEKEREREGGMKMTRGRASK